MSPENRKQQLLSTAVSVFATKGIDASKHADIASAAGVAVPTVFSYFPNRESLVREVLDEVARFIYGAIITPVYELEDHNKRLFMTGSTTIEAAKSHPDYVKVWLMWSMHFAPELQTQYRKFEDQILDELAELIKAGSSVNDPKQDVHDQARVIMGASAFLSKMVFDGVSRERQEEFLQHVIKSVQLT